MELKKGYSYELLINLSELNLQTPTESIPAGTVVIFKNLQTLLKQDASTYFFTIKESKMPFHVDFDHISDPPIDWAKVLRQVGTAWDNLGEW